MQPLLATARLRLRKFTAADGDKLFALDNDPAVMRFLTGGAGTPRAVIEKVILPRFTQYDAGAPLFGFWAIETQADAEFAGWISLRPVGNALDREVDNARDREKTVAALGFRLRQATWGQGYATEAGRALLIKAFAETELTRVVATTYQANLASQRALTKIGLKLVRRYRLTPADVVRSDTFHVDSPSLWDGDDLEYAVDRSAWPPE